MQIREKIAKKMHRYPSFFYVHDYKVVFKKCAGSITIMAIVDEDQNLLATLELLQFILILFDNVFPNVNINDILFNWHTVPDI